ncbi:hypothetical protein [Defluviimonas sp. WL0075]|uniref:Uncharacterized protein n=1 Tax=Albidovulum sediminicola TaxID=2984331 RepID=A0ABT2YYA3_9RHOB|nr:hypothetical protein [Defluviimonas sp. WL0075]MCV2863861.1 hypothetical protein [Defluviimonas sp. WL0075]
MCLDYPKHDDAYINAGKLIAIGRIYAASPQRGAGRPSDKGVDFFAHLGRSLVHLGLDEMLASVGELDRPDDESVLKRSVGIHDALVQFLEKASRELTTGKVRKQASFASKYLHFHRPNAFLIMDSRARAALRHLRCGGNMSNYEEFCRSVLQKYIPKYLPEASCSDWTPRAVDCNLLNVAKEAAPSSGHVFDLAACERNWH